MIVRTVSSSQSVCLKRALEEERDAIVANDVGYRMLGKEVVLPTASIVELCKQAKYINCEKDIECIPGFRSDLVSRVYHVMMAFFN